MASHTIDMEALQAEFSNLSIEDLQKQLLDIRTKQKVQQKKYQNTDTQKAYREKRAAAVKAMTELAKSKPATLPGFANLYEQIKAQAAQAADQILAEQEADSNTPDE